jgi:soluble lytic murein transglycosylase-like protein
MMLSQWLKTSLAAALVIVPVSAHAFCFNEAGKEYNLSPNLLYSIGQHESGLNPKTVHWNTNGTYDFGLMGINTVHEPELRRNGIPWQSLADPCTNVRVGAWILSKCIAKYGYSWEGVGCYNSQTPSKRNIYANKIYKVLVANNSKSVRLAPKQAPITEIASLKPESLSPWESVIGLDSLQ